MDYNEQRFQVFVSSTFLDLEEERQKVLQAILEMRAFPAGMELFPAADDEQLSFIRGEIASSDYYIVIVAGKYGSLHSSGKSYTEMEYDYAVEQGKYVITLVADDLNSLLAGAIELDGTRRKLIENFRAKVMRARLVRKYKNPDELKSQALAALSYAFNMRPGEGWVRGRNGRRLDDLEQMNNLQRDNASLRAENSRMLSEHGAALAPLFGSLVHSVSFGTRRDADIELPIEAFNFQISWETLFWQCFSDEKVRIREARIAEKIARLIVVSATHQHPSPTWSAITPTHVVTGLSDLVARVRSHFVGGGLLRTSVREPSDRGNSDYMLSSQGVGYWELTEKGHRKLSEMYGSTSDSADQNATTGPLRVEK